MEYIRHSSVLFIIIPLALSAFTHLWNPVGFPSVYIDENTYIRRAVVVLQGDGPVDKASVYPPYDHPFFGQIFLAAIFGIVGFPDNLTHEIALGDVHSIEMLYLFPRLLMGIFALVSTFFVYKISEHYYNNRTVAFIAAVLFAVTPMTWLLRMVMLESIQLPLILGAILAAIYIKKVQMNKNKRNNFVMVLISGILIGVAILTKMPAVTIIPLGAFLVFTNSKDLRMLGLWFIPIILIPLIWPIYALSVGDFNLWLDGVYHQTHRDEFNPVPLSASIKHLFNIDYVLMIMGIGGIIFALIRRDLFPVLWSIPLLVFFYFIHSQFFLLTPILPAFCIAIAKMINDLPNLLRSRKIIHNTISYAAIFAIGLFGLIITTNLITTNVNSAYIEAVSFITKFLHSNDNGTVRSNSNNVSYNDRDKIAIVSEDRYYWIPQKILLEDHYYKIWDHVKFSKTEKVEYVLFIVDDPIRFWLTSHSGDKDNENVRNLQSVYNNTFPIAEFKKNTDSNTIVGDWSPSKIQIRSNRTYNQLLKSSAFENDIRSNVSVKNETQLEVVLPSTQSRLPSFWDDSQRNCDVVFKCAYNVETGWKDNKSFQISTIKTINDTWSSIYGEEITVGPLQYYQMVAHMALNEFATQSHLVIEGYNNTSKSWYQIAQCPSGTNGPLDWREVRCNIIIPDNTTEIRPVLNAGWSLKEGKEAVTYFDSMHLYKISDVNDKGDIQKNGSINLIGNPNFES